METKTVQQYYDFEEKIDILAKEMGPDLFADVVDFDMEMSESAYDSENKYDYKILMARRFFVLHTGLDPLIKYNYKDDLNESGTFVTNLSIALEDLEDKKILISDDTFLHGRAIKRIIDDLIECGCKRENIRVRIYLRNEDAEIIDPSLLKLIVCKRIKNENTWRHVSGKIVDAFMESGWPYMCYLPYYETELDSDWAKKISCFLEEQQLQDNAVASQKRHDISSYLYHEKNNFRICRDTLVRIYKYERINKLIIIPYAYLKPLTYSQIAEAFHILETNGIIIGYNINGKGDFLQKPDVLGKKRLKAQYAYSLLSYISSLLLGTLFLDRLGLEDWKRNTVIEEKSLGCKSIHYSKEILKDAIMGLQTINVLQDDFSLEENTDINGILRMLKEGREQSAVQGEMDADYFLDHYLKLSSERDEQLAKEKKDRMHGIELERIYKFVPDKRKVWKKIEEVIDTGRGTIAVAIDKIGGKDYVDSLLFAGEQNHACNEENLARLIYPLLQYEMFCQDEKIPNDVKKKTQMQIINAIMNQNTNLRERITQHEIELLMEDSFARNYEAYYFDHYSMFKDEPEVQQGMDIEEVFEKEYKKE